MLRQADQRSMGNIVTPQDINALAFLSKAALRWQNLLLVALQELTERHGLEDLRVRRDTEAVDLSL